MKLIDPSVEILSPIDGKAIMKHIELCGKVCYKSEKNIKEGSADVFVSKILNSAHLSVIEHVSLTVKFIGSRAMSHQLVRHRIASYSQESQRYVRVCDKPKTDDFSDENIIELYESGLSMKKVANLFNGKFTEWDIYKILNKNNIPRRQFGNRGIVISDFFEKIDSPIKAYLLGFIQADGNISPSHNQLTITQKNGWFIKKIIEDYIKPGVYTGKDRECDSFTVCHPKIIEDLQKHGIVPNKTYDMTEQNANDLWNSVNGFEYDFIRGFMDGDGSIRFFKQNNPGRTFSCNIQFIGNKYLLNHIAEFIFQQFNYKSKVRYDKTTACLHKMYITNPAIALKLCEHMYENFVFPYGHPVKTSRGLEHINHDLKISNIEIRKRFEFVCPRDLYKTPAMWIFVKSMEDSADSYESLIKLGLNAQDARGLLPNACKTEVIVTANLRSWRHFLEMRTDIHAQDEIRFLANTLLKKLKAELPVIFSDIQETL